MNYCRVFGIIILFLFSCTKKQETFQVYYNTLPDKIDIEDILFLNNDSLLICGGIQSVKGEILISTNGSKTWEKCLETPNKLFGISKNSTTGMYCAVGDSTGIILSQDIRFSNHQTISCDYFWTNDHTSLRRIFFYDSVGAVAIGNDIHERGNVLFSWDGAKTWSNIQGKNGLEDWWIFPDNSIIAVGYGIAISITNKKTTGYMGYKPDIQYIDIDGDYFTGVNFTDKNNGYICGFDGGIYKTTDGGVSWKTIYKKNALYKKRIHFNDIIFSDNNNGWVCGENGLLMQTNDGGNHWKTIELDTKNSLKVLRIYANTLFIGGIQGEVISIQF